MARSFTTIVAVTPTLVLNVLHSSLYKDKSTQIQVIYTNNMGVRSDVTLQATCVCPTGLSISGNMLTVNKTGTHIIIATYLGVSALAKVIVQSPAVSRGMLGAKKYSDVFAQAKAEIRAMKRRKK